jgi:hypothetical protein
LQMFVLFLIAAASLPDEPGEAIDLRDFYAGNRRYFWALVVLFQLGYTGLGIYFMHGFAHSKAARLRRAVFQSNDFAFRRSACSGRHEVANRTLRRSRATVCCDGVALRALFDQLIEPSRGTKSCSREFES